MVKKCYKVIPPKGILIAGGGEFKKKTDAVRLIKRIKGARIKKLKC